MSNAIICQQLYGLTVAIRRNDQSTVNIGTGFVISKEKGLILTCIHVVRDACGCQPTEGVKVSVYFPKVADEHLKIQNATVIALLADYDDDIALLKLDNGVAPIEQNPIELGRATNSLLKPFYSYGYGRTNQDQYLSLPVTGHILGQLDANLKLHVRRVSLKVDNVILSGHSGSPVLDIELNRIVGVIIASNKNFNMGMATDCEILLIDHFAQFGITLSDMPQPKESARTPKDSSLEFVRRYNSQADKPPFGVPSTITEAEWVGRENLLASLHNSWENQSKRIVALIGLGGEGKSSLVQHWQTTINAQGIFWWSFYNRSDVDEFFEEAIRYFSNDNLSTKTNRSEILGAFLYCGKCLFILDGFEVMQCRDFDRYGEVINSELQLFLEYFASPSHDSRCLITSRIPLNFGHYTTFTHYDVDRLSPDDGRLLLRKLGVTDKDNKLDEVVQMWEGHALTLTLIGSYLRELHSGKVVLNNSVHIEDLPRLVGDERRMQQVTRVLSRYDDMLLDENERSFLLVLSTFRLPVNPVAFVPIFRSPRIPIISRTVAIMDDDTFADLIKRLKLYRIIHYDSSLNRYTMHPLIRDHYTKKAKNECPDEIQIWHRSIKDYYLSDIPETFSRPALKDLTTLIEAIHHSCCATDFEDAFHLYNKQLTISSSDANQTRKFFHEIAISWLGAYEVVLSLLKNFFVNDDISNDPQVSAQKDKSSILRDIGSCLMHLGRLGEVAKCYVRAIEGYREEALWGQISNVCQELTILHFYSGRLIDSITTAEEALSFVVRPDDPLEIERGEFQENLTDAVAAWALVGFIDTLGGDTEQAKLSFEQAKELHHSKPQHGDTSTITVRSQSHYGHRRIRRKRRGKLPVGPGLRYTIYLWRSGQTKDATSLVKFYLRQCKQPHQPHLVAERSQCYRIMGDIASRLNKHQHAGRYYSEAVKIARDFFRRDILIEALSARGRWYVRCEELDAARYDLLEALDLARTNGYRVYEVDIRVGLAWMYRASGQLEEARREAEQAQQMSEEMGYYWGKVEAQEI